MNILTGFLIAIEVIVSLLLILIVLVQPSKSGGGLGGAAFGGGGMGEQLFGARAGNVLTKGTVLFAVIFLVNTMLLALVYSRTTGVDVAPAPAAPSDPLPQSMMALPDATSVAETLTEEAETTAEDVMENSVEEVGEITEDAAVETEAVLDEVANEAEAVVETVEDEIEEVLEEKNVERTED